MQVFELHFNPKLRKNAVFDTFYYEPEGPFENKLGSLFMAGELEKAISPDSRLLKNIAQVIKTNFYKSSFSSVRNNLRKSLKEANKFLEGVVKQGDVSWLSNLNFIVLSLASKESSLPEAGEKKEAYELNFTGVGNIEVILISSGEILNLGERLKLEEIEPYPLKVFSKIISGRVNPGDKVLVLGSQIHNALLKGNGLKEIAGLVDVDERKLADILGDFRKSISGVFLLVDLPQAAKEKIRRRVVFKEKFENLNPASIFYSFLAKITFLQNSFKKLKKTFGFLKEVKKIYPGRKKIALVASFILLLFFASLMADFEEERGTRRVEKSFEQVQEKVERANNFLALEKKDLANDLYLKAWEEIEPLSRINSLFIDEISLTKREIEEKLFSLNKLEMIAEPEVLFEFEKEQFLPQKMVFWQGKIYFFNPYLQELFELNSQGETSSFKSSFNLNNTAEAKEYIIFFLKPDELSLFDGERWNHSSLLEPPYQDFKFKDFVSLDLNLYFWDERIGQIVRYKHLGNFNWPEPNLWLEERIPSERSGLVKSMAVDSGIWLLEENDINRYFAGELQKTISFQLFPEIKSLTKIKTTPALSQLYILEPVQKRIIIVDKQNGEIIKQYQSNEFDNLKDFAFSPDGKMIYLLNGARVYKISQ